MADWSGKMAGNYMLDPRTRPAKDEKIFQRTLDRLMRLPGKVEIGRTSDVSGRYAAWYPFGDNNIVHIRLLLLDDTGELTLDSNLTSASGWPDPEVASQNLEIVQLRAINERLKDKIEQQQGGIEWMRREGLLEKDEN